MINHIILVGRTTKKIELKQNKNGTNYVQFTLAVNRPYKDEQADFINCVAWNKTAETIAQYVSKGTMIGIEGRLQVRNYENEAGVRQYISEVLVNRFTFLESKKVIRLNHRIHLIPLLKEVIIHLILTFQILITVHKVTLPPVKTTTIPLQPLQLWLGV